MDLSNDCSMDRIISGDYLKSSTEFIAAGTRIPGTGTSFAELGAAMLGVGCGDTTS